MSGPSYSERFRLACHRAAYVMHSMWEERGHSDTRLLLPPLIADGFVTIGKSRDGAQVKEHIIPRKVIVDRCHQIFSDGGKVDDAEKLILDSVRILRISRKEAQHLNRSDSLNLRQSMPEGWDFETGDKFARIKLAEIEFELDQEWPAALI